MLPIVGTKQREAVGCGFVARRSVDSVGLSVLRSVTKSSTSGSLNLCRVHRHFTSRVPSSFVPTVSIGRGCKIRSGTLDRNRRDLSSEKGTTLSSPRRGTPFPSCALQLRDVPPSPASGDLSDSSPSHEPGFFFINKRTFTVCDVLKTVARKRVKVHQLRSQFGFHQSPRMSLSSRTAGLLFFWRSLDDTPRKFAPVAKHVALRLPQGYHLPSSCATLQPCHLEGRLAPLVVWCPCNINLVLASGL